MAEVFSGVAYCVKCKDKREMQQAAVRKTKNGRNLAQAPCPVCNTKLSRMLGKKDEIVLLAD